MEKEMFNCPLYDGRKIWDLLSRESKEAVQAAINGNVNEAILHKAEVARRTVPTQNTWQKALALVCAANAAYFFARSAMPRHRLLLFPKSAEQVAWESQEVKGWLVRSAMRYAEADCKGWQAAERNAIAFLDLS